MAARHWMEKPEDELNLGQGEGSGPRCGAMEATLDGRTKPEAGCRHQASSGRRSPGKQQLFLDLLAKDKLSCSQKYLASFPVVDDDTGLYALLGVHSWTLSSA